MMADMTRTDIDEKLRSFIERAEKYIKHEKYKKAIKEYDKAISLYPDEYYLYSYRGNAYEILRDYTKALENYNRAIELDNDHIFYNLFYNARANLLIKMGDYNAALLDYSYLLSLELPLHDVPCVDLFENAHKLITLMENDTHLHIDTIVYNKMLSNVNKLLDPNVSLLGELELLLKNKLSHLQEYLYLLKDKTSQR